MKTYKEFLLEKLSSDLDDSEIIDYMTDELNIRSGSFSTFCYKSNEEIEEKLKKAIDQLDAKIGHARMKELATNLVGDEINYSKANGLKDLIFYHYNPKFLLSGISIDTDPNSLIRYSYGWHTKKYTKMAILQQFGSIDAFIKYSLENTENTFNEEGTGCTYHKTLLLDDDSNYNEITSAVGNNSYIERECLFSKKKENGHYIVIEELLDLKKNSILENEDYRKFFDKVCKDKPNIIHQIDWHSVLKNKVDDNYITSKIGISKFNL